MQRASVFLILALAIWMSGCNRHRKISDFNFRAGLTSQQLEEEVGSADRKAGHWLSYKMDDGNEVRVFFLGGSAEAGPAETTRTITQASLYGPGGSRIKMLFELPQTAPTTKPALVPTTSLSR